MNKIYFKNVDMFRFVFAVLIVLLHMSLMGAEKLQELPNFSSFHAQFANLKYCVELFFIISGFIFTLTLKKEKSVWSFIKSKFIRLSPVIAFTVLLFLLASLFKICKFYAFDDIFSILLLNGLHIAKHSSPYAAGLGNVHPSWFVSALFWTSLLFFYFLKNWSQKLFNLLLATFIIINLRLLAYNIPCLIDTTLTRAICGMGIGYFFCCIYLNNAEKIKNLKFSVPMKIFTTLVNIGLFAYLIFGLLYATKDRLVCGDLILMFIIVFCLFIIKQDYFSKIFDNNISVFLGKISYSIFITHSLWLDIFKKYYYTPENFTSETATGLATFAMPILVCIVFGAFTYLFVEKPITKYLSRRK